MVKKIFVGNLSWRASEGEVRDLFSRYGDVHSVTFVNDKASQKFRGFGFVEMESDEAEKAIQALNQSTFRGNPIWVKEAKERRKAVSFS